MSVEGGATPDLLVILDGLAEPISSSTTLALGRTPFLDRLARAGRLCRIDPQDAAPVSSISSERGIARLLGFSPEKIKSLSRASLLAMLSSEKDRFDWFYVATPAYFDNVGRLLRYVNPPELEDRFWRTLLDRVTKKEPWRFLPIFASDGRIDRMLVGFAHPLGALGVPPRRGLPASEEPPFPEFYDWILQNIPSFWSRPQDPHRAVNGVWLWGGGGRSFIRDSKKVPEGVLVGAAQIARALGILSGFHVAPLERATGDIDTDLSEKIGEVEKEIKKGAARIVLHLEGFDMASHRKSPEEKRKFLERTDRVVFSKLFHWFEKGRLTSICITSDHQSSPVTGNHESGPVPALTLKRGDAQKEEPVRMTEWTLRKQPVIPMEEWISWHGDPSLEDESDFSGKDLCLAL